MYEYIGFALMMACAVALVTFVHLCYLFSRQWLEAQECKHTTTIKLSSIQKQICADCNEMILWPLKEGQPPLVSSNRDRREK